ncbi:DUF3467 domain-containing protein [Seongchinamella sediminis]|uniref:DUF3467 domain-containing protein n=1 Tax=Seongchinamella sediminis TaxID=2283635 RepID=A0A3L7E269_9GAMM|nr:DUF3467 domain-containing protein [Seongchinamella sediminis]RLQ23594.1 DUF3467 domain-containing protein [Seongchinamella sediminis]
MSDKKENANTNDGTEANAGTGSKSGGKGGLKVHWDDSDLATSYANVVNAAATQEEVTIFFGTNQTWNVRTENEMTIKLSERIILNPLAAKRLLLLLGGVLKDYERKYGTLDIKGGVKPGE